MLQSRDFKELLSVLEKHEVRYLVVGGYAVMLYSEPRSTFVNLARGRRRRSRQTSGLMNP